jgi:hypothetical protein
MCPELCVPKCHKDNIPILGDGNTLLHTCYKEEKETSATMKCHRMVIMTDINKLYVLAAQE